MKKSTGGFSVIRVVFDGGIARLRGRRNKGKRLGGGTALTSTWMGKSAILQREGLNASGAYQGRRAQERMTIILTPGNPSSIRTAHE